MKILMIKPLEEGGRKFEVVSVSINIPETSDDIKKSLQNLSDFLNDTSNKIEKIMKINSVSCVKLAYGNELPEFQIFANEENISDCLMTIVNSCEKKKLEH
jgi:hypothetical protein